MVKASGTVTAGNASGLNDGAAAMLVAASAGGFGLGHAWQDARSFAFQHLLAIKIAAISQDREIQGAGR